MTRNSRQVTSGAISILVLVFGLVSTFLLGGLIVFVSGQYTIASRGLMRQQAFSIAEAGLDYYRWHLAHNDEDFTDGNGPGAIGPFVHTYSDPGGTFEGEFALTITEADISGIVEVISTGTVKGSLDVSRTLRATYGVPSLAQYAFLHNSNVWFGTGMTVEGPVLSNGGIRQDGVNTSTLKTSKETYTCGIESGCDPEATKPGIWGHGGPSDLWEFPVTRLEFEGINLDFNYLQSVADAEGLYRPPSGQQGYHIVFDADGSFELYQVVTTDFYPGWSFDYLCQNLYQTITSENLIGTYQVADNPVIFLEDTTWVEGTLNGQTTVVAARFPIDSYQIDIWIPDNLVYLDRSGAHKLGLIAQHDIAFAKDVPDYFEVNGALLSKSSRILRHHYNYQGCRRGNPEMKNELTIFGSVMSNLIAYWNFGGGGGGNPTSGFVKRTIIYDTNLYYDPPPFFPSSGKLELVSWEEIPNP
jgi:hypothetical protein